MLIGAKVFSLCLNDYWILQIACISAIISMITTGFSWYITEANIRTVGIFIGK